MKRVILLSLLAPQVLTPARATAQTPPRARVIVENAAKARIIPEVEYTGEAFPLAERIIEFRTAHYATDPSLDDLNKLKALVTGPLWTNEAGYANSAASALRSILRSAHQHGLNPNDYWDLNLESHYQEARRGRVQDFENRATAAVLRYVAHINGGRLDPQQVDSKNIKFKLKKFMDFTGLAKILSTSLDLANDLETYAPTIIHYKKLMHNLSRLEHIRAQGNWKRLRTPTSPVSMGQTNPAIGALRTQFNNLGYISFGDTPEFFDSTMAKAVTKYLKSNSLPAQVDSKFWASLNKSIEDRIQTIEVNLEKLRWIPKDERQRYAFVNLAAQEITLKSYGTTIARFNTVNGRVDRQTPSMIQEIKGVIFNPTWTVPAGLAMSDKIPAIRKNPSYFYDHNLFIKDVRTNKIISDLSLVRLSDFTLNPDTTPYYFVQGPGNSNALGVIKFPLNDIGGDTNSDDIYMHDTNERILFAETTRYRSSGCIRLQFPLYFAAELLKDKGWTINDIRVRVPWDNPEQKVPYTSTDRVVNLSKALLVYVMYLTADQNDDGSLRFFDDSYGMDAKIQKALDTSN